AGNGTARGRMNGDDRAQPLRADVPEHDELVGVEFAHAGDFHHCKSSPDGSAHTDIEGKATRRPLHDFSRRLLLGPLVKYILHISPYYETHIASRSRSSRPPDAGSDP